MCLRYAFTVTDFRKLDERFGVRSVPEMRPRYNIAPTQEVPVIFGDDMDTLALSKWGIEGWAQHTLFNARAETIDRKPSFRKDFEERRCLMLATTFYEWKQPEKKPFRVFLKGEEPFAFAAIYDPQRSCCMVTVPSNELIARIHPRMPAILPMGDERDYLEADPEEAKSMLRPFPPEGMGMYEISSRVNKAENDSPDIWEPKTSRGTLMEYME